ncbi:HEAT repeat domain-containing protein [Pseudodesulfovibrio cashew]|uniref:HEAT repeat domain-containing protein n=1 Tax=Pseudodesulfovibrio cashew TaxID=2678688 RepID=UPI00131B9D25|nr:HEAT repeat domain-containing protein [Pseudodesulfovibrio cashew]
MLSLTGAASASAGHPALPDMEDLALRLADPQDRSVRTEAALELRLYGQEAQAPLTALYRKGTTAQRRGAVIGLALLPYPGLASDTLLSALGDPDPSTRSMAAHGLAILGSNAAPWLAARLESSDFRVRNAAAFGLRLMGAGAVDALSHVLASGDTFARAKAAWLLGTIGPEASRAIPALIRALDTEDERAMHVIAEAVDLIGPDPAVALHHLPLIGATGSCVPGRIGSKAAPVLVRLLSRPGTPLAQFAFKALADIGAPAAPALRRAIGQGSFGQQVAAALLLVEIDPNVVGALPEKVLSALQGVKHHTKP